MWNSQCLALSQKSVRIYKAEGYDPGEKKDQPAKATKKWHRC